MYAGQGWRKYAFASISRLQNDDPMTGMPPIAVLAGGLATRMRPLTSNCQRLSRSRRRALYRTSAKAIAREASATSLLVATAGSRIKRFVGGRQPLRRTSRLHRRRAVAARHWWPIVALSTVWGRNFLVTYCDSWLDAPYAPVVEAFQRAAGPPSWVYLQREPLGRE